MYSSVFHLPSITQSLNTLNHIFQINIKLSKHPSYLYHLVSLHNFGYIKQETSFQNKQQNTC